MNINAVFTVIHSTEGQPLPSLNPFCMVAEALPHSGLLARRNFGMADLRFYPEQMRTDKTLNRPC
jgi:hypothetical protein